MTLNGKTVDNHVTDNDENKENQERFTTGGQIEDNIFILHHWIEDSFRDVKPLIITEIEFCKAFDSVERKNNGSAYDL